MAETITLRIFLPVNTTREKVSNRTEQNVHNGSTTTNISGKLPFFVESLKPWVWVQRVKATIRVPGQTMEQQWTKRLNW